MRMIGQNDKCKKTNAGRTSYAFASRKISKESPRRLLQKVKRPPRRRKTTWMQIVKQDLAGIEIKFEFLRGMKKWPPLPELKENWKTSCNLQWLRSQCSIFSQKHPQKNLLIRKGCETSSCKDGAGAEAFFNWPFQSALDQCELTKLEAFENSVTLNYEFHETRGMLA